MKANRHFIENIIENFAGHRYYTDASTFYIYIAESPEHKLCFPFLEIDKIDSLEGFMGMLKETIRQTDTVTRFSRKVEGSKKKSS